MLQLLVRLRVGALYREQAIRGVVTGISMAGVVTLSILKVSPLVRQICAPGGAGATALLLGITTQAYFFVMMFSGASLSFSAFRAFARWPVSRRSIGWCSVLMMTFDPRIVLLVGPLWGAVLAASAKGMTTALLVCLAFAIALPTAAALAFILFGVLRESDGRWTSTLRALALGGLVAGGLLFMQRLLAAPPGAPRSLLGLGRHFPLTALLAVALEAQEQHQTLIAWTLLGASIVLLIVLIEVTAWLGFRSATK